MSQCPAVEWEGGQRGFRGYRVGQRAPRWAGGCCWSSAPPPSWASFFVIPTAPWPHTDGGQAPASPSFCLYNGNACVTALSPPGWVRPAPVAFWNTSPCCTWCTHTGLLQLPGERGLPIACVPVTCPPVRRGAWLPFPWRRFACERQWSLE